MVRDRATRTSDSTPHKLMPERRQRTGSVRIIGGQWRGRRIDVADAEALRPTSDRVRETLFNWLMPTLPGARCLDLFAGTGVLGFEAVSRGAAHSDLIELDGTLAAGLRAYRERLATTAIDVIEADAMAWLTRQAHAYDIVFVDPPFARQVATEVLNLLTKGWLAPAALIYIESARDASLDLSGFELYRQGHTQQVSYALVRLTG